MAQVRLCLSFKFFKFKLQVQEAKRDMKHISLAGPVSGIFFCLVFNENVIRIRENNLFFNKNSIFRKNCEKSFVGGHDHSRGKRAFVTKLNITFFVGFGDLNIFI